MTVDIQEIGAVAIITIKRPERRNAVDWPTAQKLYSAFKEFDNNDALSVAILTGEGGNFCAGADLQAVAGGEQRPLSETGEPGPMGPTRMRLKKPVIAAIDGYAVAGGLELALWCDMRVASPNASLGVFCRRFGVPLIDLGTVRLPRLIGQSRASDLILTGREVDSKEAFDIGLINRITEEEQALPAAIKLAEKIASFPQQCLRNDRQSMYEQWGMNEESACANEMRRGLDTLKSGEALQGAKRFKSGVGRHGEFD